MNKLLLTLLTLLTLNAKTQAAGRERLTNLPHVYIDTFSGNAPWSKINYVYARMWYVDEKDSVAFYDSLQIRVRGNSTANLMKKPYKLKFNEKVKLLGKGRPNTKKWTLLANHADKTLLRNALTSLMGEQAGLKFNPAAKFVDLTLNGQYVGNYQFSDQVDVRPHRVNVVEQDLPLTEKSNITGGYLMEADGFFDFSTVPQGPNNSPTGFYTRKRRAPIRIHYPDEEDIERRQYDYIQQFVQHFEDRLYSEQFADPETGYRKMVDSTSLVNWYLCTEISANPDGFFSTYFYKEQDDDRLFWGPLWDYDIAYNNDNRTDRGGTSNTEHQLMKDVGYGTTGNGCRDWFQRMWHDPWFARLVNRRFTQIVDAGLEQYLNHKLDSLTTLIDASQQLNFERWGISSKVLRERVLYSSYDRYVSDVRLFLQRHLAYLDYAFKQLLPDTPDTPPDNPEPTPGPPETTFEADSQRYYTFTNSGTGTRIDLNTDTDELCGNQRNEGSHSQQWRIYRLNNGYFFIVNRATGMAMNDPSPAGSTATTNTGAYLDVADADSTDNRQMWTLVSQGDNRYNLVSRWSGHAANLSGGNAANLTPIVSYTSDARDSQSGNRIWVVEKSDKVVDTAIDNIAQDYALAYDPQSGRLHFGADNLEALTFSVSVYNRGGQRVATFRACDGMSMTPYPTGLYIISWRHDGRQNSVKLVK